MQFVNDPTNTLANEYGVEVQPWPGYSKGMAQPAVVVISSLGEVVYYWKSYPSIGNFFGARDRVAPKDILARVCDKYPTLSTPKETVITFF
jgi:peroxiredoxin